MYHIHKDSQDLYKKDGSSHQIFLLTAVDSDEENDDIRKQYIFKTLSSRKKDYSRKKYRLCTRNQRISKISDKI